MSNELKPCPFCGGKPKLRYRKPFSYVVCTGCKSSSELVCDSYEEGDGKADAIAAWNRRANDVQIS